MIVWRYILLKTEHGPSFDAERVIIVEPLFLMFGLMLTTIYIDKMDHGGLFAKLRAFLDDPINWKRSFKIMLLSTIGSAVLMNDSVVLIFSGAVAELCRRHKVANSLPYLLSMATAANIGSALTKTGNSHNFLIVTLAYDDIDWLEFFLNMGLPVLAASVINAILLFTFHSAELFPGASGIGQILGIMFAGYRTPEMLAQERAYSEFKARRLETGDDEIVAPGWSVWAKIQLFVTLAFLIFFALGYNVCVVSIVAGGMLMVISAYKRKHHDREPAAGQHNDDGNPLGSEAEPAAKKLALESETTLVEIDYGLLLLFIG
jgi:Na+/H+ antiporter NhaD/arsenite permease-like protein